MVKLQRTQHPRLKRALQKERNPLMRRRIQLVVLRETGMTRPETAEVTGVSLITTLVPLPRSVPDANGCIITNSPPTGDTLQPQQ